MRHRLSIVLTVIMIFAVFNLISCSTPDHEANDDNMSLEMKTFTAREVISGKTVDFPAAWSGKAVYLNFFMTS